ncbi:hypothetical protein L228DRAFT_265890 [Xylona heveae TC161]|uniref:Uncharacterized protein n=1 Tax=Xylona heveae (strain CBS 132557 / TC161) TaxID=1328760 RepID=A0A165IUU3_XYLHT|nr:hypothetical protein L228DRAFT_265890 [Xylona heveae TC161]KZF25421.1 hypothetical protein L228DRAFT_265890 [Xylona heveae TC161]
MLSHKIHIGSGLVALLCLSIAHIAIAAPTTTSLDIRAAGTVAEHFDQGELVKRVNIGLLSIILNSFEKVAETACAADIEPTTKAAICAVAVGGLVMSLVYGAYKAFNTNAMLAARQEMDLRLASNMIHTIPRIEGKSATSVMKENYAGIPLLVGYNDCFDPGCFQVHYQPHTTKGGASMHHLSVSPRNSTLSRRQDNQEASDDDGLYGDYLYHDEDKGAEGVINDDDSKSYVVDTIEKDMDNDEWTNTGVHCFNVLDTDSGTPASSGYLVLNNGNPYQDPDQEDSWIDNCQSRSEKVKLL